MSPPPLKKKEKKIIKITYSLTNGFVFRLLWYYIAEEGRKIQELSSERGLGILP